jgi:hypothetical protein
MISAPGTIIQINGDNPAVIQVGATYSDLGVTITSPTAALNLGIQTFVNGVVISHRALDLHDFVTRFPSFDPNNPLSNPALRGPTREPSSLKSQDDALHAMLAAIGTQNAWFT